MKIIGVSERLAVAASLAFLCFGVAGGAAALQETKAREGSPARQPAHSATAQKQAEKPKQGVTKKPAARKKSGTKKAAAKQSPKKGPAKKAASPAAKAGTAAIAQLETLARQMRAPGARAAAHAYWRMATLQRHWPLTDRRRAGLALGHYQYTKGKYESARRWFHQARRDRVLGEYALYWEGLAAGAAGQDGDAVVLLGEFRRRYPDSVMAQAALGAYADAAMDVKQPRKAIAALRAFPETEKEPDLLLRLALAEEKAGGTTAAARDFQRVYDRYPLDPAAKDAEKGIGRLREALGAKFPEAPLADRLGRAEALYHARRWRDAGREYARLAGGLSDVARERAELRVAECEARRRRRTAALESLKPTDAALDAERWVALELAYRAKDDDTRMVAAAERAVALAQKGKAGGRADEALFVAGNYYWANLKRDRAVDFYRRLVARGGAGGDVVTADWRVAWTAYLEKADGTAALMRGHVERFPDSPYVPDALYWLGRLAERAGKRAEARAYYDKVATRFVETYFGRLSRKRLAGLGREADPPSIPLLGKIPPVPAAPRLSYEIPAAARRQYDRALALRSIAFDNSAMLELRAAYRRTRAPGILLDAARAAQAAEHYLTGAALVRQLIPDLEARPMASVPKNLWRIVYPLPYDALIRENARHYRIDPMLLASLIRQESGFQPDVVSHAGAIGLAQLMPFTARKWSRKLRLRYYRRRLTNPRYNLRVGGAYFQWLTATFGSAEAALAAYNAGEDRVAAWEADRHYAEPAEFVESIPFSQTRHYVQVVMNGAVIYRRLYEGRR